MEKDTIKGVKVGLVLILALAVVYWLYYITHFFLILFAAALFAAFLGGIAHWVHIKTKINYRICLTCVIIGIMGIIVLGSFLLAPTLAKEFKKLSQTLPKSVQYLQQQLSKNDISRPLVEGNESSPENVLKNNQSEIFKNVKSTFEGLVYVILIFVMGLYLASSPDMYKKGLLSLVPLNNRDKLDNVLIKIYETLKLWLFARAITMTIVAIITTIGLLIIGIPLATPLGIIAGLLDFVPNIGPIMASIPAILIAFMESPQKALVVFLLYMSIQMIEGYVLTPLIEHKTVALPPVLILVAQLFFGLLAGLLGVFLASPLLATLKIVIEEYHIKKLKQVDE